MNNPSSNLSKVWSLKTKKVRQSHRHPSPPFSITYSICLAWHSPCIRQLRQFSMNAMRESFSILGVFGMTDLKLVLVFAVCFLLKVNLAIAATESVAAAASSSAGHESQITNNNSITIESPAPATIPVDSTARIEPVVVSPVLASNDESEAVAVLGVRHREERRAGTVGLIPLFGWSTYTGTWGNYVSNSYSTGLILDLAVNPFFSLEAEGSYGEYQTIYSAVGPHRFKQYGIGGNLKVYLTRGFLRPYHGAGILGNYYENMFNVDPYYGRLRNYSQWVGSGQIVGGADLELVNNISIGARAAWIKPIFNQPQTVEGYPVVPPAFADAALMNVSYFRFLGTVKVSF